MGLFKQAYDKGRYKTPKFSELGIDTVKTTDKAEGLLGALPSAEVVGSGIGLYAGSTLSSALLDKYRTGSREHILAFGDPMSKYMERNKTSNSRLAKILRSSMKSALTVGELHPGLANIPKKILHSIKATPYAAAFNITGKSNITKGGLIGSAAKIGLVVGGAKAGSYIAGKLKKNKK